jgi:hypothetical protein
MESIKVRDLMVPAEQYLCVDESATLHDAVAALYGPQAEDTAKAYPHQDLLVQDKQGHIIGKLSQLDVLRALEPRYSELADLKEVSGYGLSRDFLTSMMKTYELWEEPLDDLCRQSAQVTVGSIVAAPVEGEFVDADGTLDRGAHQMIIGHHQSLLVTSGERFVGILRLTDVFREVSNRIKSCKI